MMKLSTRAWTLLLAGAVALAGCQGSKGDTGQTGATGGNGADGSSGATGPTGPTGPVGPGGVSSASTGLKVTVVGITGTGASASDPVKVHFTLKDDRGYPVDISGLTYSVNQPMTVRFGLAYTTNDAAGNVQAYSVLTKAASATNPTPQPSVYSPTLSAAPGTMGTAGMLVENGTGAGDYTYTFPTSSSATGPQAVALDSTSTNTHVLWMLASRQTNTSNADDPKGFTAVNQDFWFVPAGGTPVKRAIVFKENCSKCHRDFKPGEGSVAGSTFHGGQRVEPRLCNVCHNPARTSGSGQWADSKSFVHRIHNSANLQAANIFDNTVATYPQDIRNCQMCHAVPAGYTGDQQVDQYKTNPTRVACGSCHDYVSFVGAEAVTCTVPTSFGADGKPVPCNHKGGTQGDDLNCSGCHLPAAIQSQYHLTVARPDDNSVYAQILTSGTVGDGYVQAPASGSTDITCTAAAQCTCTATQPCQPSTANANTNAAWLAAAKQVPAGAKQVTYEVASVDKVAVTGGFQPTITFRFLVDGVATPMQTYAQGTTEEIFAGFVGSPSVYFAYALPQDGNNTPADFNASASGYIRNIWNGIGDAKTSSTSTTGTQGATACTVAVPCTCTKQNPCQVPAGTISGPDAQNFYTVRLTNVVIPASVTLLTGGVGYTYSLGAFDTTPSFIGNTQPLTQIDLGAYPYVANPCVARASCGGVGGLIVPAPDKWKVAIGYVGRRSVVDTAKCQTCHVALGAEPTFHAGQRNDAPTCSFCHTPNRTSSGWSAAAKNFIHGIHAGRVRSVAFNWHAPSATETYGDVEFPGPLNNCTACHVEGGYNFTAPAQSITSGTATVGKKGSTVCTAAAPCTCTTSSPCTGQTQTGQDALYSTTNAQGTNLLFSTVGAAPSTTVLTYGAAGGPQAYTLSPYVDPAASYGQGYSVNASGTITNAASTTLVISPIAAACVGCHDAPMMIDHMEANGAKFYQPRSAALAAVAPLEQCMICHGPGTIAPIADVHK
jgi:OmcA/MtrC family decaheme c-type cytochrome